MTDTAQQSAESHSHKLKKESIWEVYYPSKDMTDKEAIPVASFPMIIFFWPTMLTFLLCGLLQGVTKVPETTLGLVATAMWAFNLLVIVTDLDQKKFIIAFLLVVLLGVLSWVASLKEWSIMVDAFAWLRGLDVRYSTQAYFTIGSIVAILLALGMTQPRFNYWRFEANEFVHYVQPWGRDQSIPRQGSTVVREIPDVLEFILSFGGGTLAVRREGQVIARIEHVPFLGRRMIGLERLLGSTRVTHVVEPDA